MSSAYDIDGVKRRSRKGRHGLQSALAKIETFKRITERDQHRDSYDWLPGVSLTRKETRELARHLAKLTEFYNRKP